MRIEAKIGLISLSVIIIAAACGGRSGTEIFGYEDRIGDSGTGGAGGAGGAGGSGGSVVGGSGGGIVDSGPGGSGGTATGGDGGAPGGSGGGEVGGSGGGVPDADVPDVGPDSPPPVDAAPDGQDFFDALPPLPDSGPVSDCVACLQDQCADEINACYNDPTCVEGVQCTVTECLSGGGTGGGGGSGGGGGGVDFQCVLGCFDNDFDSAMTALSAFQCVTGSCSEDCGLEGGGGAGGAGYEMNGMNLPPSLFGGEAPALPNRGYYIGSTRIPRPEEVASAYPWFAEVLAGRMPNPPPPCILKKRAAEKK